MIVASTPRNFFHVASRATNDMNHHIPIFPSRVKKILRKNDWIIIQPELLAGALDSGL